MSTAKDLTTTSYAILGLLAVRPWSTYELAQQMERALGEFWPRAISKLYEEPKKLVGRGLASASEELVGKRRRTVYRITPKGRRALAKWVPEPGAGPVLEFEQLVKIFFAEHGSTADLLAGLARLRDWTGARAELGVEVTEGYLRGDGPFPERLPWLLLVGEFLERFDDMLEAWIDWAEAIVEQWPDDVRAASPDVDTLERMARTNRERAARAASARDRPRRR